MMLYKIIRGKYTLLLLLLLNTIFLNAQKTMDYTNEDLKTKSKTEIVQIAKDLLKEKYPAIILNTNEFDARVWTGDYGEIKVIFRRFIRYVTNETDDTNYDITINMVTKEIIPFNTPDIPFYIPSKKAEQTIETLKEKGLLPKKNKPDVEYTITENEAYYLISCFDNAYDLDKSIRGFKAHKERPYLSKTLVNKETGETLFFKGNNPFFFLTQVTFKHYYKENSFTFLNAKNTSNKTNEINKIATSILKEKYPDLKIDTNDFNIQILGNYKDLIVKYRSIIRFNKHHEKSVFDLAVNIITKEVTPLNTSEVPFYVASSSDKKAIKSIQKIIPLEHSFYTEHTVSENEDYFLVTSIFEKSTKKNFINKKNHEVVWTDESYTLQTNNREDLTLQEQYKRMNRSFNIELENIAPLVIMASAILKDKKIIPNINLDNYSATAKASKNEVVVTFTRLVKFIPLRHKNTSNLEYNLKVNLVEKTVAENPDNFYFPTKEDVIITNLIETKLAEYLSDPEKINYPIEIIEDNDFYIIKDSANYGLEDYFEEKQYRMDKNTQLIQVVSSPISPIYPTPLMEPLDPKEIE